MICVIIPALNPDEFLVKYVQHILSNHLRPVIVVNDGSNSTHDDVFSRLSTLDGCVVLTHETNRGKGRALKTAYKYFLANCSDHIGLITADADGQHALADVLAMAAFLRKNTVRYAVVGQRDLYNEKVPLRSRLGNRTSAALFCLLYGRYIGDTQCGLRAFSADIISDMLKIGGERYDYEMRILAFLQLKDIALTLYPIQTIYIDNNRSSYYRTFSDTARIFISVMSGFFRYFSSSVLSAFTDVLMFALGYYFFFTSLPLASRLLWSTVLARIVSSVVNYLMNKYVVFRSRKSHRNTAWRYYFLWLAQMLTSYVFVLFCALRLLMPVVLFKALVDIALAAVSYQFQLRWVFKNTVPSADKPGQYKKG